LFVLCSQIIFAIGHFEIREILIYPNPCSSASTFVDFQFWKFTIFTLCCLFNMVGWVSWLCAFS
jgi:hypothetical protein